MAEQRTVRVDIQPSVDVSALRDLTLRAHQAMTALGGLGKQATATYSRIQDLEKLSHSQQAGLTRQQQTWLTQAYTRFLEQTRAPQQRASQQFQQRLAQQYQQSPMAGLVLPAMASTAGRDALESRNLTRLRERMYTLQQRAPVSPSLLPTVMPSTLFLRRQAAWGAADVIARERAEADREAQRTRAEANIPALLARGQALAAESRRQRPAFQAAGAAMQALRAAQPAAVAAREAEAEAVIQRQARRQAVFQAAQASVATLRQQASPVYQQQQARLQQRQGPPVPAGMSPAVWQAMPLAARIRYPVTGPQQAAAAAAAAQAGPTAAAAVGPTGLNAWTGLMPPPPPANPWAAWTGMMPGPPPTPAPVPRVPVGPQAQQTGFGAWAQRNTQLLGMIGNIPGLGAARYLPMAARMTGAIGPTALRVAAPSAVATAGTAGMTAATGAVTSPAGMATIGAAGTGGLLGGPGGAALAAGTAAAGIGVGAYVISQIPKGMQMYEERVRGVLQVGAQLNYSLQDTAKHFGGINKQVDTLTKNFQILPEEALPAMRILARETGRLTGMTGAARFAVGFGLHGAEGMVEAAQMQAQMERTMTSGTTLAGLARFRPLRNQPTDELALQDAVSFVQQSLGIAGVGSPAAPPMGMNFAGNLTNLLGIGLGTPRAIGRQAETFQTIAQGMTSPVADPFHMMRLQAIGDVAATQPGGILMVGEAPQEGVNPATGLPYPDERMRIDLNTYRGQRKAMQQAFLSPEIWQAYAKRSAEQGGPHRELRQDYFQQVMGLHDMALSDKLYEAWEQGDREGFMALAKSAGVTPPGTDEIAQRMAGFRGESGQKLREAEAAMVKPLEDLGKGFVEVRGTMQRAFGDFYTEMRGVITSSRDFGEALRGLTDIIKRLTGVGGTTAPFDPANPPGSGVPFDRPPVRITSDFGPYRLQPEGTNPLLPGGLRPPTEVYYNRPLRPQRAQ